MSRPYRLVLAALSLTLLALAATALGGCAKGTSATGSGSSGSAAQTAVALPTLELVAPVQGSAVPAGDVRISVKTTGLKFVNPGQNVAGEGHVHFTLDGQPVKMSAAPEYTYAGIAAGEHKLVAELVQNDTQPFSPAVKQEITFTAKSPGQK